MFSGLLGVVTFLAALFAQSSESTGVSASPPSLSNDISFHRNLSSQSSPNVVRGLHLFELGIRQSGCAPSYPIFCDQTATTVRCCQSGSECCPTDCCPTDAVCYPNGKCCPKNAVTCNKGFCAVAGSTCCGQGVCQPGAECMTSKGGLVTCCSPGQQACDDGNCCDAGTECSADVGYCDKIKTSTLTSFTTSTSSSTTSSSTTSSTSTPKISTPKQPKTSSTWTSSTCTFTSRQTSFTCTTDPTPAAKRHALATDAAQSLELEERQSDSFLQYCNLCGQQIPVMIFPYVPGETEELISSTCNGIGGGDQILLHWGGDGKSKQRRKDSGCRGYCASTNQKTNTVYDVENECDEFPPASSREGGAGAHIQCIAGFQNQLGGKLLQSYAAKKHFNLQPNQPYIIRVVPGCRGVKKRTQPPLLGNIDHLIARDASSSTPATTQTVAPSATPSFLQDPRPGAADGSGFYLAQLPDAPAGNYQLLLYLNGTVSEVTITDGDGIEYAVDESPNDSRLYTFSLEVDNDLSVGAYVQQNTTPITMTYTANITLGTSNSTNSTSSSSRISSGRDSFSMLVLIGVSFALATLFVL